jgi:ketosteroid isomerase-like protein
MSQANVDAVLRSFDAWNRGDFEGWIKATHADMEWSPATPRGLEGAAGRYRGHAALKRFWDQSHEVWDVEMRVTEVRDLGDRVLAFAHTRRTGKSSGVVLEQTLAYLFEIEDGLARRAAGYLSPDEALAAAGLTE